MRPFSAFTYIKNNKWRSAVLVLMMSFITVCFIGGMYADNPGETFRVALEGPSKYLLIEQRGNSNDSFSQFDKLKEELPSMLPSEAQTVLNINHGYCDYDCIMMFNCTTDNLVFGNEEDFELFKQRTGLVPQDVVLHDRQIALSEQLANNRGLKLGDPVKEGSSVKVGAIMDVPGMQAVQITDVSFFDSLLVISSGEVDEEKLSNDLNSLAYEIMSKYPLINAVTNATNLDEINQQISFMNYIFGAIVVLVGIVLLITINAAFTAAYDKRKHEFAIYKAIGFTKGQIFRKVASEVLILNVAAMALGAVLNVGVILVLNQVFWSSGHHFYRPSKMALIGTLIAEVLVILSLILLNWRKVRKCEVTEE
jgi:ABC-type antimicrobial peptide transport system permease subunit